MRSINPLTNGGGDVIYSAPSMNVFVIKERSMLCVSGEHPEGNVSDFEDEGIG